VRAAAIARRPGAVEQAVGLRRIGAVRLLVEAGFSIHGGGQATPLHQAAYSGDLELVRVLLELGADPGREDPAYRSTPLGWAEHAGAEEVAAYLRLVTPGR
jgi:ankyrin repeat protein